MKDINLMPKEHVVKEKKKILRNVYMGIGFFIILGIIIGISTPYGMIKNRKEKLTQLNMQLTDAKYKVIDEVKEELMQKQKQLNSLNQLLNEIEEESIVSGANLDLLIGFLPTDMYIENLNMDDEIKSIQMEGSTTEEEKVSEYVVQLTNLPFVEKVDMETNREVLNNKTIVKYQLTLQMEGAEVEGAEENDEIEEE
ncbi:PilN domain-containing protein [Defluviitalea phaphyphila]|uniref:PilN domain-containing protein n=1 Tax=Defluviitalea phaphyphila TaxID=1473580 RepID=UPI0007301BB1|nr:PilN domain-containing protein [Defluviitalea phaphyphila]